MTEWIHCFSGKRMYPLNPNPDDICIEDIAHALSLQCRYTGHCRFHYSVGQHSLLVMSLCPFKDRLWGLLHDASEAYLTDVASPLKHQPEFEGYREAECYLTGVIADKFELAWNWDRFGGPPQSVHDADQLALMMEAPQLMGDISGWDLPTLTVSPVHIRERQPRDVEREFLDCYEALISVRAAQGLEYSAAPVQTPPAHK